MKIPSKNKMAASQSITGKKVFNFASGISLLLFYAFALQCADRDNEKRNQLLEMAARATYLE
jgi:hypothetical protein